MIRKLSSHQIFRQMYGFKWYKLKINDYMGSSLTLLFLCYLIISYSIHLTVILFQKFLGYV